jgi:2-polyprenyl-6-hydroxyphenyl methylase/3-demethylubiquinone-9 3-methyltransferase
MIASHEAVVASRFDALHERFKATVDDDDYRLRAILAALGSMQGRRVLDLGCGKGRFARKLQAEGASVVGMDVSAAMLAGAGGVVRVRASARRLPFAARSFDSVLAVEVIEHMDRRAQRAAIAEARRVLTPKGSLVIVDKNLAALNTRRPWLPALAVKRIDEQRGLWMYPPNGPVRERWFWPAGMRAELRRWFAEVRIVRLLAPAEEGRWVFRRLPATRLMTLWVATGGGGRDV